MGDVVNFHIQGSARSGYRSGRNSCGGTPDKRETASTRSGGTSAHCDTACTDMPSGPASPVNPPTAVIARFKAALASDIGRRSSMALGQSQDRLHCSIKAGLYNSQMTLGKRIASARENAKKTQLEIGKKLGISEQAVSGWERDENKPSAENLVKLALFLKVSAIWLWTGEDPGGLDGPMRGFSVEEREAVDSVIRVIRARKSRPA